jgi:YD repeat-containing protein
LEPGSIEHKYYCHGLGQVLEAGIAGGKTGYVILVEVIQP